MRALHVIGGPPGVGKTTSARLIVRTFPSGVHIHGDDFWHYIGPAHIEPWLPASHEQNAVVMSAIAAAAARFSVGGYDTIVDGGVGPWFLDPFIGAAQGCDLALNYVVIRPELEVTLRRVLDRRDGGLSERGPVLKMYDAFSSLGRFEDHVIDSSTMSPEETATAIRAGLDRGRFRVTEP